MVDHANDGHFMVDKPLNDHGRPWSDAGLTIIDHELTITNWPWSTMVKHGQSVMALNTMTMY